MRVNQFSRRFAIIGWMRVGSRDQRINVVGSLIQALDNEYAQILSSG